MLGRKKKSDGVLVSYDELAKFSGTTTEEFKKTIEAENKRVADMIKETKTRLEQEQKDREFRVRQHKAKVKLERKRHKAKVKAHKKKFKR